MPGWLAAAAMVLFASFCETDPDLNTTRLVSPIPWIPAMYWNVYVSSIQAIVSNLGSNTINHITIPVPDTIGILNQHQNHLQELSAAESYYEKLKPDCLDAAGRQRSRYWWSGRDGQQHFELN